MDSAFEQKLRAYMNEKGILGEHLVFQKSCRSVAEAAAAVEGSSEDFVKNVCMIDDRGRLIVAIVWGKDRASTSKIGKIIGTHVAPRIATPEEVFARTGYPCGGTPSFGYEALFLVDSRVLARPFVYTGGGSEHSLIRISPNELVRANGAVVASLRK